MQHYLWFPCSRGENSGLARSTQEAELTVLAGLSSHMEALGEKPTSKLTQTVGLRPLFPC